MSGTETWDFVLAAAQTYAHTNAEAVDEGQGATAFGEPVVYWMNRAATDAALDYAKMIEQKIEPYVARLACQLATDLVMALAAAEEILGCNYGVWSGAQDPEPKPWGQW